MERRVTSHLLTYGMEVCA